jgi:hypothetical protein
VSQATIGGQLREQLQAWLSPPDPSINYNTARDAYHDGTAAWFTQHHMLRDWKGSGSESFLWIHGKRKFISSFRLFTLADACPPGSIAGSGKSILRYIAIQLEIFRTTHILIKLCDYPRCQKCLRSQATLCRLLLFQLQGCIKAGYSRFTIISPHPTLCSI